MKRLTLGQSKEGPTKPISTQNIISTRRKNFLYFLQKANRSPKQKIFFSSIERTDKNERMKDTIIKDVMSLVRLKNETNRKKK